MEYTAEQHRYRQQHRYMDDSSDDVFRGQLPLSSHLSTVQTTPDPADAAEYIQVSVYTGIECDQTDCRESAPATDGEELLCMHNNERRKRAVSR